MKIPIQPRLMLGHGSLKTDSGGAHFSGQHPHSSLHLERLSWHLHEAFTPPSSLFGTRMCFAGNKKRNLDTNPATKPPTYNLSYLTDVLGAIVAPACGSGQPMFSLTWGHTIEGVLHCPTFPGTGDWIAQRPWVEPRNNWKKSMLILIILMIIYYTYTLVSCLVISREEENDLSVLGTLSFLLSCLVQSLGEDFYLVWIVFSFVLVGYCLLQVCSFLLRKQKGSGSGGDGRCRGGAGELGRVEGGGTAFEMYERRIYFQ